MNVLIEKWCGSEIQSSEEIRNLGIEQLVKIIENFSEGDNVALISCDYGEMIIAGMTFGLYLVNVNKGSDFFHY